MSPASIVRRDRQRRAYLQRVFDEMRGPRRPLILDKARHLLALWEERRTVAPTHVEQWRRLLGMSVDAMETAVLRDSEDAAELRHCMPFAGVLSNRERAESRLV